jgi:predicted permease
MEQIATIIAPTFFVIALGVVFGRVRKASVETLIDVALYLAVPCLVLSNLTSTPINLGDAGRLWTAALFAIFGPFLLAVVLFAAIRQKHSGLYLPTMFGNVVNIPFPIIYLAFGAAGLAQAIIYYVPTAILTYTLGIYIAAGNKGLRQGLQTMLKTPLLYAAVVGLILNFGHVALPKVLADSLKFMGQAGVPLLLVVLGMNIGRIGFTRVRLTSAVSLIRVGGGFAFGLLVVTLLGLSGVSRSVVLFESAMPSAVFVSAIAIKYKNEAELVSSVTLMTTLASIAVIPGLLFYLK